MIECQCGFQVHVSTGMRRYKCPKCKAVLIDHSQVTEAACLTDSLPFTLADRWHAIHRWPLRNHNASPEQVAAFFYDWDQPLGCGDCQSHYLRMKAEDPPDLTSASGLAETAWRWHNRVNARRGVPEITRAECDRIHGMPNVGFIVASMLAVGGTETWNQTIIPRLHNVKPRGVVVMGQYAGRHRLGCPVSLGPVAAKQLARRCDVLVTWGVPGIRALVGDGPKIVTIHHGDLNNNWFQQFIANQPADAFVAVNHSVIGHAKRRLQCPCHYIPNAVDPARCQAQIDLSGHPMVRGRRVVLWTARFSPEKRPELAIAAARSMPNVTFVMVGGTFSPSMDLPGNVITPGVLPSQADWLAVADVFLSTADQEGFGLSMAEAMAAGVPVVATPVGLGSHGSLVTQLPMHPNAPELVEALNHPHLEKVRDAQSHVFRYHGVADIVAQWERLIASLAS